MFGLEGEHDASTVSVNHLTGPKPSLTMANVSRLPSSDKYRVFQPTMDYKDEDDQGQTNHSHDETTSLDSEVAERFAKIRREEECREGYYNDCDDVLSEDYCNFKQRWFRWPWQKKEYGSSDGGW